MPRSVDRPTPHIMLRPNGETSVSDEDAVLTMGAERFECEVSVSIRFLPVPDIVFRGRFRPKDHPLSLLGLAFDSPPASLCLNSTGDSAAVSIAQLSAGDPASFVATIMKGILFSGVKEPTEAVQFHLINFPNFLSQEEEGAFPNSAILEDAEYEVQLLAVDDDEEVFKTLKAQGGFGNTHVGIITRLDGAPVSFEGASDTLRRVHCFLSFARGAWTGIALPVGVDDGGEVRWREFGMRPMERWSPRVSWLDRHNCQVLASAYRGFSTRWADEYWQSVLEKAIYWYLRSNNTSSGVDGGIILTQAALEYMAWTQLVEFDGTLSKEGFERLPASDRLRLLLLRLEIPLAIPTTLEALSDVTPNAAWDGPRTFTEVRNDLVHPVRKKGRFGVAKLPYFEAWTLGQWYLELVLLRLMGFDGVYHDRTRLGGWVGEVRPVPWGTKQEVSTNRGDP